MVQDLSIATLIEREFLSKNVPPSKIILGFPLYGRKFLVNKPYVPAYYSEPVNYRDLPFTSCTRNFDSESKVPWLSCGSYYISYDDEESLQAKMDYAKSKNLGGLFMWALGADAGKIVTKIPTPTVSASTMGITSLQPTVTILTSKNIAQNTAISIPEKKINTLMDSLSKKYTDKNTVLKKMEDLLKKLEKLQADTNSKVNKALVSTYITIVRDKIASK